MGIGDMATMGYRSLLLPILLLVYMLCNPAGSTCDCNGLGAGADGEHAPCQAVWGDGLDGDPELRRFCFVDSGVCEDQKNLTENIYWSHRACYEFEYIKTTCQFIPGTSCSSGARRLLFRYGGGGSGSWKRPKRKGG